MDFGYADPPYPGRSHYYREHPDYAGEVDHVELLERLERTYDGWLLHTHTTALLELAPHLAELRIRVCAWCKKWAAQKKGQGVLWAWEPVIVRPARERGGPETPDTLVRDWHATMPTFRKGLVGAKPPEVCIWLFAVAGLEAGDTVHDLYPGTGAVAEAWATYAAQPRLTFIQPHTGQEALEL